MCLSDLYLQSDYNQSFLMNQDAIEKNYYEQLMVGHYIDVKYSENQWKIAKILEKDKRYAVIAFQGINSRQERVYLNGYKVAPLRMHTEGYTGSIYRPFRPESMPISEYKNHLEILQHTYLKDTQPNAFTSTQYLRGELFVMVHSLLSKEEIKEEEANQAMRFMMGFAQFVVKFAKRIKKMAAEYFEAGSSKYLYLVNEKVGFVNCFNELLILLNYLIKAENSKHLVIFKSKFINQDMITNFFLDMREQLVFAELFRLNDGNGKWLSSNIHKHLYALLKKFSPKFSLPDYKLKDYQEVFTIFPYIIKQEDKNNVVQQKYINFIINCLKQQSSFEAKLKAIQQLKKLLQGQVKLFQVDDKKIYTMISQQGIIDHMLNQFHFNPQIFKRFTPILQNYCKVKSLNMKNINSLFKLASTRHQSEVAVIFEIICMLAEFIQVDALDFMYGQILKYNLNNQQTIQFLKSFTIKAITNYSKQKSFFSSLFKKSKNSGKYGNYALDLYFKQLQDDGVINKQLLSLVFDTIKQIFNVEIFQSQRSNYLGMCIGWLEKGKNYGQGLRLIDCILSTYPSSSFFGENKKDLVEKLISKNNLLQLVIFGLKAKPKSYKSKIPLPQVIKYLYEFLDNYYDFFLKSMTIQHIQYLWNLEDTKLLAAFLKKPKINQLRKKDSRQKYVKKLEETVQDDILNKLIRKPQFFQRNLTIDQFEALDQIFISYNLLKKKIEISQFAVLRYLTPQMQGYNFYFQFLGRMTQSAHIQKIIKKTINVFLRSKDQKQLDMKVNTWKMCLLKMVDKLKSYPQICLKATSLFFEMIQGKLTKINVSAQGNIDVVVNLDNHQKIITLPKNSTIFKLRKQIMIQFNIHGDFTMHSQTMRRDITFFEQQQYSLNALSTSTDKGPQIDLINRKKQKHFQMQAVEKFKELIEKEQTFYSILFGLNNEKINQLFWKTIDLLPVNRQLIRRIQNCANFTIKEWKKLLANETAQSLQYHLNIIYQLLQKNDKWVSLFYQSGGFAIILQKFSDSLKDQHIFQRIVNRCMLIIVKVLQTINLIDNKLLEQLKLTLVAKVLLIFKGQLQIVSISIESLNLIFRLLNITNKLIKTQIQIDLEIMLKIVQYGVFKPTNKITNEFIKHDFEYYLINNFNTQSQKLMVYQHLLSFLNIDKLIEREHSELLFTFLIDFMNTFVEKEEQQVQRPQYINIIKQFVMGVLNGNHQDPSKQKYSHIILGAFKLLLYTLKFSTHTYNYHEIFDILLKRFLLNKQSKKIKHEQTIKSLYQCLKKILFTDQNLIHLLVEQVAPLLRHNQWRKNTFVSWSLEAKRQQRNLFCGLQNLGATCYINCLIQQLFMINHFRENFLAIDSTKYRQNIQSNEIYQFQSIFAGLKYSNKRSISSRRFCQSFITYEGVPINPMVQSDADQFFSQLMQKLQIFLKGNKRHDIVENTFQGKLSNQLNCQGCPHNSQKQQNFMSIGVNIRGKKALQQALQGYVEGQVLDGDNAYFCQICQKKVRTQKRLCIKSLPNILIIVLKRFEFNFDQMRKIKINTYLNFPMQLNMKKYTAQYLGGAHDLVDDQYSYFLRGTVIHSGTSEGGHYYSFINSKDKWYSFNDQFIEQINIKRVEEDGFGGDDKTYQGDFKMEKYKNAYILFYQKSNPPPQYHKQEADIVTPFSEEMQKSIITQNNNADFLSVMLDSNFIRLGQNLSALDGDEAYRFTMLYFHTVVLRDRNKQEYIPNYYRILQFVLSKQEISYWYLTQINHRFLREFLIQASRTVRFVCTSLVLQALKNVQKVPEHFVNHALFALKKNGMTPFAKIFKSLSERPQLLQKMTQYQYPQRVISFLLEKTNDNFKMIEIQSFESYFGADSSDKQKERENCTSALCQSLINFNVQYPEILQIFQKYHSRNGSKALAKILAKKTTQQHLGILLITLESNISKQGQLKREQIEKYMFLIRYICLIEQQQAQWRINKCFCSLKKMIYEFRVSYEPMQTLIRQINFIASRNKNFLKLWKSTIIQKQNLYDIVKTLKYWLKEAQHPQQLQKSEQFRRKIASVSYEQKYLIENQNKALLQKRVNWMIEKDINDADHYDSDIDDSSVNRQVIIRNKKFKIKEHLGLLKKIDVDGNQRWGILEKSDFQICINL